MAKQKTDGGSNESGGKEIPFPIDGGDFVTLGKGLQNFDDKSDEKLPPGTLYAVNEEESEKSFQKFVKETAGLF